MTKSFSTAAGIGACARAGAATAVRMESAKAAKTFMRMLRDSGLISHMTTVGWRFPLAGSVVVVALTAGVGTQSARPMGIVDLRNNPRGADPQVSPAGRHVVCTPAAA